MDKRLGEMNENMEEVKGQLCGVEARMEKMKEYLREVRELFVAKDSGLTDKRKAPMEP